MIDPSKLQNAQESEDFNDAPLNNDAFQLESLPTYPGSLPYENSSEESASQSEPQEGTATSSPQLSLSDTRQDNDSSTAAEQSPDSIPDDDAAALRATLQAELDRSKEKKSKKDNLEDSINRLKARLQTDPQEDAAALQKSSSGSESLSAAAVGASTPSILSAENSDTSGGSDSVPLIDDFEELPVDVPQVEKVAHDFDEELVDSMPPTSETALADGSNKANPENAGNPLAADQTLDASSEDQVPSARRIKLGYAIAAAIAIVALGASGIWWKLSSTDPHSSQQLAQNHDSSASSAHTANEHPTEHHSGDQALLEQHNDAHSEQKADQHADAHADPHATEHSSEQNAHAATHQETGHADSHATNSGTPAHSTSGSATAAHDGHSAPAATVKQTKPDAHTLQHPQASSAAHGAPQTHTSQDAHAKPATALKHESAKHAPDAHANLAHTPPTKQNDVYGTVATNVKQAPAKPIDNHAANHKEQNSAKNSTGSAHVGSNSTDKKSLANHDAAKDHNAEAAYGKNSTQLSTTPKASAEKERKSLAAHSSPEQPMDKVVKPKLPPSDELKKNSETSKPTKSTSHQAASAADQKAMTSAAPIDNTGKTVPREPVPAVPEPRLIAKPVIKQPASSKGVYTVQVYSSPSKDDAEDWMKRLRKKNIENSSLSMQQVRGTIYYRVRFGNFVTKEEAEGAAINSGFASSWVDRVK